MDSKWIEDLPKFNEKNNEGYFLEFDVQYNEHLREPHNDLPFLPEIKKVGKVMKTCG